MVNLWKIKIKLLRSKVKVNVQPILLKIDTHNAWIYLEERYTYQINLHWGGRKNEHSFLANVIPKKFFIFQCAISAINEHIEAPFEIYT